MSIDFERGYIRDPGNVLKEKSPVLEAQLEGFALLKRYPLLPLQFLASRFENLN